MELRIKDYEEPSSPFRLFPKSGNQLSITLKESSSLSWSVLRFRLENREALVAPIDITIRDRQDLVSADFWFATILLGPRMKSDCNDTASPSCTRRKQPMIIQSPSDRLHMLASQWAKAVS